LRNGDEYATDVVATSVIEGVFYDDIDASELKPLLGDKTLKIWDIYEKTK
jgi:hypothetical protein